MRLERNKRKLPGSAVVTTGSMFTRAGTNGVDKSFSSGCCGETGAMATSEMRFPQRVRVQILAVTQKSFALMQGDLLFRPIDVIGQAVGDVASLSCRKRITRARSRENSA